MEGFPLGLIFALSIIMIARLAWRVIMEHREKTDKKAVKLVYREGVRYIRSQNGKGFKW